MAEFKRLNYFRGLFMTEGDFRDEQAYHSEKLKLHNKGLHTPGILSGVGSELRVEDVRVNGVASLTIRILPGAALDSEGREILLASERTLELNMDTIFLDGDTPTKKVYIVLRYGESPTDHIENMVQSEYSGDSRIQESPAVLVILSSPDNKNDIEVARIELERDAVSVTNPPDPSNPRTNEIDRRYVVWAGAKQVAESWLPADDVTCAIFVMQKTRSDFAELIGSYPTLSMSDVRQAAVTAEIMAHSHYLQNEQMTGILSVIADLEDAAGREIKNAYPEVTDPQFPETKSRFEIYQTAVLALTQALQGGRSLSELLPLQVKIADAAQGLAVSVPIPVADAGQEQNIAASDDPAIARLDATNSRAYGSRSIKNYRWKRTQGSV